MSGSLSARTPPSRAVGNVHLCILLILGVGIVLMFSYQFEIHQVLTRGGRRDGYGSLVVSGSRNSKSSAKKRILKLEQHSNAVVYTKASQSGEKRQLGSPSSGHSGITSNMTISTSRTPSNSSTKDASPPPPKKKNWRDDRVEAYKPLVRSVESNILSSKFRFVIKVLVLNDYASLVRCLSSLAKADYTGDVVDIHIYIDHFEIGEAVMSQRRRLSSAHEGTETKRSSATRRSEFGPGHIPDQIERGLGSVESSDWGMVELKLWNARRVLNHAESFPWKHGKKIIHYSSRTVGSQQQWLDAWWPSSDDEFALFVEDDVELSPLYYRYARTLIATYYYEPSHFDPSLYGISLQRAQIVPGKNGQPLKVNKRARLFKYQMVGIFGQIFFPKPWKEFREWYDSKKSHDLKPVVDGMMTTDMYKKYGEKIVTAWFVKFVYNRGYFNLYTNFLKDSVLSVTHRDMAGKSKKCEGCDSDLLGKNGTYDIDLWHMAAPSYIERYDCCFRKVREGRFAKNASDMARVLKRVSKGKEQILMVSTVGIPEILVKNWLCKISELNIENYVLVGDDPDLLEEMARRGHATMGIENTHRFKENLEKEASAISDVLELGYSVWFTRADTIWLRNPLEVAYTDGADIIGVENSELNLFFIRSAKVTILLWDALLEELFRAPRTVSIAAHWETARKRFIETSKEQRKLRIHNLQQVTFIDGDNLSKPPTLDDSADVQVFIFSDMKSSSDYEVKAKLGRLGLWNLDDDLACSRLIC